jgi:hypothetical protein
MRKNSIGFEHGNKRKMPNRENELKTRTKVRKDVISAFSTRLFSS